MACQPGAVENRQAKQHKCPELVEQGPLHFHLAQQCDDADHGLDSDSKTQRAGHLAIFEFSAQAHHAPGMDDHKGEQPIGPHAMDELNGQRVFTQVCKPG